MNTRTKSDALRVIIVVVVVLLLVAVVGVMTPIAIGVYRHNEYHSYVRRIRASIESMSLRRPPQVDADAWQSAIYSLLGANGNVCFSPYHAPLEKVRELCVKFESRVKGPVDLSTVEWMWDEFAAVSPHGAQHAGRHRANYLAYLEQTNPEQMTDKMREHLRAWNELIEERERERH